MKKFIFVIAILIFMLSAFSIKNHFLTSIYGTIDPPEAAAKVWAISGKDSVTVEPAEGRFSIAVPHAGTWKLIVHAEHPYKDAVVENIAVQEGKSTDAGTIRLTSQ